MHRLPKRPPRARVFQLRPEQADERVTPHEPPDGGKREACEQRDDLRLRAESPRVRARAADVDLAKQDQRVRGGWHAMTLDVGRKVVRAGRTYDVTGRGES